MKENWAVLEEKFLIDLTLLEEIIRIALLIFLRVTQFMLKNLFWTNLVPTISFFWMENLYSIALNLNGVIDDASFGTLLILKLWKKMHYVDLIFPVLNH